MAFYLGRVSEIVGERLESIRNNLGGVKLRKREEDLKNYRVTVQVSKREKEKLYKLAAQKGMTPSDFIRIYCIYEPYKNFFGDD